MRADTQLCTIPQGDDLDMARILRKLLPVLRRSVRRDDMLSISDTNTIVAVFNADQSATELLATRLKNIIATQRVSLRNIPQVRLLVSSHVVSFGQ